MAFTWTTGKAALRAGARGGLAVAVFGLVLTVLRFGPTFAAPRLPVPGVRLVPAAIALAILCALSGGPRPATPWRKTLGAAVAVLAILLAVARLRGAGGLGATASGPGGSLGILRPGPIDVIGDDLDSLPRSRKTALRWLGELRIPERGVRRLWAVGRGQVEVRLDGNLVLAADGERLDVASSLEVGGGPHQLEVTYQRTGPGPRLRLGWDDEVIPPRHLGPPLARGWWWVTDALAMLLAALVALLAIQLPWDARPAPFPVSTLISRRDVAIAALAQLGVVCLMSWPLVAHIASAGPFGQPDGRLNAWILAWGAHALTHAPARLFDAPIFHPLPDALAFSENLILPALLTLPAQLLGGPAFAYNLALLLSAAASGVGVQLLVLRATGDRFAAFVGAAFFAAGIHRWVNMAHLHAHATAFLPFTLLALDRFFEQRTLRRALGVGLLLSAQGASSVYLGAITAVLVGVALVVAGCARRLDFAAATRLALAFLVAVLLLWPLARPYLRMRAFEGEEFTLQTVTTYATTAESYLASASPLYEGATRRHLDPDLVHDPLFPGVVALALGIVGLAVAPPRYAAVALLGSGVAVLLSLGPATAAYRFLHEHLVLLHGIRALGRFAIVPTLSLAVLMGLALAGRGVWRGVALTLLLAESWLVPLGYTRLAPPAAAASFLSGRSGAVVSLPLGEDDTRAMLDGLAHFRPLMNGDSGFMPRPYGRAMELLNDHFGADALRLLRAADVRDVVSRHELALPEEVRFGETHVYRVPPGDAARAPVPATPRAALWTSSGPLIDLGVERDVDRVTFEVGEGSWLENPRVLVSSDGAAWRAVAAEASLADATWALYRDPRGGLGELRVPRTHARFLRLDRRLPVRVGTLGTAP